MQLLSSLRNVVSSTPKQSTSQIPINQVYDILANKRRRAVLEFLASFDAGEKVDVRAISSAIAEGNRQSVYITLIQTHLIQFDSIDCVDYDDRAKVVTVRPELHALYEAHKAVRSEFKEG